MYLCSYFYIYISICMYTHVRNEQNICNLIGREIHNIGRIVLSVSILYSLTNTKTLGFRSRKNRNYLIKNKLITNRQGKYYNNLATWVINNFIDLTKIFGKWFWKIFFIKVPLPRFAWRHELRLVNFFPSNIVNLWIIQKVYDKLKN